MFTYLLLCLVALTHAQTNDDFCLKVYKVNILIQKNHYAPKAINNQFSEYVFDNFLKQLDSDQTIFLQEEIDSLSHFRHELDDAIFKTECGFMDAFVHFYENGLKRNLAMVQELREETFVPEPGDTLRFVQREKPVYYDNIEKIKNIYRKRLTYEVLDHVARSGKNKDSLYTQLPLVVNELRLQQLDNYTCRLQNLINPGPGMQYFMEDLFINVFCSYFDPHTNFFSADAKSGFFNSLSSGSLGLGLIMELSANNEVNINDIQTGSPAFLDPLIEKGDRLMRVGFGEKEYEVNCTNMNVVHNYFYSDNYKELELTFRKKSGLDYRTLLQKEVLKNYENTTYGFLIGGKKKVGYIYIPSFYSNMEGNSTNLYNDLLFELNHLKRSGAKGFILDLQYNSGGDLMQAFYMLTLFLDQAPLSVFNNRRNGPELVLNLNSKAKFKEPIIILINGFSASASELFASTLQDQNRAVVLGQRSYGKGTLQTFFPLDEESTDPELLKVTIEKMFRMNGKSHQRNGVHPDILTPALLEGFYTREEDNTNALDGEEIEIGYKEKRKLPRSHQKAVTLANSRIVTQPHFRQIAALNEKLSQELKITDTIPLEFGVLFNEVTKENTLFTLFNEVTEKTYTLDVQLQGKDKKNIQYNPLLQTMLNNKKEQLLTNPDIFEAVQVIQDMF